MEAIVKVKGTQTNNECLMHHEEDIPGYLFACDRPLARGWAENRTREANG